MTMPQSGVGVGTGFTGIRQPGQSQSLILHMLPYSIHPSLPRSHGQIWDKLSKAGGSEMGCRALGGVGTLSGCGGAKACQGGLIDHCVTVNYPSCA